MALTGQTRTQVCTPPGPPFSPRNGVSTHRSHFCEMPDSVFHWSLTGVKGQAARQHWQPMHSFGSIIRTLPKSGFGLLALIGSTGQASTHGAFSHWRHVAMTRRPASWPRVLLDLDAGQV